MYICNKCLYWAKKWFGLGTVGLDIWQLLFERKNEMLVEVNENRKWDKNYLSIQTKQLLYD